MKKTFIKTLILIILFLPFYPTNALTTGNVYTDSIGNTHYQFSDGTSGYSYNDSAGYTHYQFSDGLYGSAYTDITGSTHYYFDITQKNKYVGGTCLFPANFICTEEAQYQETYNRAAQGLSSCDQGGRESGSFSPSSESCTTEGREQQIMNGTYGPWLKMCQEHIDLYKTAKATYDKCIQNENEKWEKQAQAQLDLLKYQIDLQQKNADAINELLKQNTCPTKSSPNSDGNCVCDSGLVWNKQQTQCISCEEKYPNSHYSNSGCYCDDGYTLNKSTATCDKITINSTAEVTENKNDNENDNNENIIKKLETKNTDDTFEEEKKLSKNADTNLARKLKGRILLQVEKNGEAWYLNPDDEKKYYLGRPADAFNVMRNLGLGIKHSELENYLTSKFPIRLAGKTMLDVEQNGEAYYVNPIDLKGYFLNRPADAFRVMRELGLGITNDNVRKINVGETN